MVEGKKIKISGVAVREGISRNDRKYTAKELAKFAPTLIGKPILKDHEGITDNVIGLVEKAESINNGEIVTYEGWVKEDGTGLLEKIKDGRIKEVSIGAIAGKVVKEKEDDTYIIPMNMEAMELSTTPVPGNKGTSLFAGENKKVEKETKEIKKEKSQSLNNENIDYKEDKMEKKETEKTGLSEEMAAELKSLKESLEAEKKANEDLKKQQKEDAIARYNEKVESKGMKPKDVSKMTLETIKALTEMADDVPEPEAEEEAPAEEPVEEPKAEENVEEEEEEKPVAQPQSKEVDSDDSASEESFDGYVLDTKEALGVAFYKYY